MDPIPLPFFIANIIGMHMYSFFQIKFTICQVRKENVLGFSMRY